MLDLGFKLFNFAVFAVGSGYIFKRYLLPDLQTDLKQAHNQVYGLEKTVGELNEAIQTAELAAQEQQLYYDQLLKQVQQWQKVCLAQQASKQAIQVKIVAELAAKRVTQSQFLLQQQLQQQLRELVMNQSTQKLRVYFSDLAQVDQYQSHVLKQLRV